MKKLEADVFEIGYGTTENSINASRADLNKSFEQMNSRW
jgi:short-subunit dehydrogenase involved in D-alanine esterification of teichoic acids